MVLIIYLAFIITISAMIFVPVNRYLRKKDEKVEETLDINCLLLEAYIYLKGDYEKMPRRYSKKIDIEADELIDKSTQFKDIISRMIYPEKRSSKNLAKLKINNVFPVVILLARIEKSKEGLELLEYICHRISIYLYVRDINYYSKDKDGKRYFNLVSKFFFSDNISHFSEELKDNKEMTVFLDKISKDLELNFSDLLSEVNTMLSDNNKSYDDELLILFLKTYLVAFNKYMNQYYDVMLSITPDNKSKYIERIKLYEKIQPIKFESSYEAGLNIPMTEIDIEGIVKDSVKV